MPLSNRDNGKEPFMLVLSKGYEMSSCSLLTNRLARKSLSESRIFSQKRSIPSVTEEPASLQDEESIPRNKGKLLEIE